MDTPRRWQVASTVTAAAGIGLGALILFPPSTDHVEPIRLDVVASAGPSLDPEDRAEARFQRLPEVVTPRVVEVFPDSVVSAASVGSDASLDSP